MSTITVIEAESSKKNYWKDLWIYRELFFILTWRDVKVKYKQTILGLLWAIIRPVLTMIVFTIVFGRVAKMDIGGNVPYAIIVFAGLLPWQFISSAITESSGSIIGNERLITKVYFPRLIIPLSSIFTCFLDFLISFFILLLLFVLYSYSPPFNIFIIPLFWILALLVSVGPSLFLTAMNVKYRDFRYVIPFVIQFGLFISPVGYASSQIPDNWKWYYYLNPVVAVVDGFRWCIIEDAPNPFSYGPFYLSVSISLVLLILSFYQFRRMEKNFADLI